MNDDHPGGETFASRLRKIRPLEDVVMALRFFSRLPTGPLPHEAPELNRMARILPVASLAIALPAAVLLVIATLLGIPGIFAAGLATALLLVVTGAMAEDGLADAADGLFGGASPSRRLEIMRDHAHGTYGVLALVLLILLRVLAVGAIAAVHPFAAASMWIAAQILARSGALWLCVVLPPARSDGLSAGVGGVTRPAFAIGAVIAAVLGLLFAIAVAGILGFLVALAAVALVIAGWTRLCQRLAGGQTGDLIGALQALLELTALTVFLGFA